ncbi:MAG TPA: class I SAM-dependent methyltransferase [Rhizomicrobium sp.]|jgi:ubiquinone/menaquinone biosynthesis C-methylase UbiE|nr:class I SAM-dependent methyltransferase [Rhizomicrobium sp.]
MVTTAEKLTYAAAQAARVAFYGAHYLVARLVARDAFAAIDVERHSFPSLAATLKGMRLLFEKDLANAEAGLYPLPLDITQEIRRARASLDYLADIPRVAARRRRNGSHELAGSPEDLPRYYRQNFHYQTDGYLSADSARLYDFQVEALFGGTADAMRRRAWVPIARFLRTHNPKRTILLDIGAGTGGFLAFVKRASPDLKLIALDLSKPYLARAGKRLSGSHSVKFVAAPAEKMPLADNSVDAAISIYLFHELPPQIRMKVAREIARVLKSGGIFVLAETIQYGDLPDCDGLIATFPDLLHEPYYDSFARQDLAALFAPAGLELVETDVAYLTKISVFQKNAQKTATAPKLRKPAKQRGHR